MRNLFKLTATFIMILVASNFNAQKKPVKSILPSIDIDIITGTKSLVNNTVVCLGGGICSMKIHVGWFNKNGISVDNDGNIYLTINHETIDESLKTDFELREDVSIESEDIETINNEARKVNPNAKLFTGLRKGYVLRAEKEENYYYIKIN